MKDEGAVRSVWPFFSILTVIVTAMFIWTVVENKQLQQPFILIVLIVLLLVFVLLFWLSPYLIETGRPVEMILGIHGAVAFSLVMVTGSSQLAYPVYMALIGETVGVFQKNWQRAAGVAVYLGLSTLNLYLLGDQESLAAWYTVVVPMTIFVVVYVILYTREAFARERAQDLLTELEEANRQLAEYASRIEHLERQRMARELHDTLAQGLAGLILQLEAVDSHLSSQNNQRAQEIVQQAMQRARATLADARRAIDNLRSNTSDSINLTAAIEDEVQHFTTAAGVSCSLSIDLPTSLPAATCEHILRLVSEGLNNIVHHAQAKNAWVELDHNDHQVSVKVRDDGTGFSPEEGIIGKGHYGLLGMRERARLAEGTLEITSKPGQGTILHLKLPL
jgi:two-component system, NarL family, sensor histidine kinase YdfH